VSSPERVEWERLESDIQGGEAYVARIAFPEATDQILAALDSSGRRHFLVAIPNSEDFQTDSRSRGISVTAAELRTRGERDSQSLHRYIDITLRDDSERELFDILGYQLANILRDEKLPRSRAVRSVIERWRHFWGNAPADVMTREEVVGLFSELWFINHWLFPFFPKISVMGWKGPYGARHDFEWKNLSIEVKGTTNTEGRKHWINGIEQLSPPEKGKLYLFSLKLREEEGAENSLIDMIKSSLDAVSGDVELEDYMESALSVAGYSPAHDDTYSRIKFGVIDEALYEVTGSFPRITRDSFTHGEPEGVEKLVYEINLEGYSDLIVSRKPQKGIFEPVITGDFLR